MFIVAFAKGDGLPPLPGVKSDGGGIRFGDLEENVALRMAAKNLEQSCGDALPPYRRVDAEIEQFSFIGRGLTPGAEAGGLAGGVESEEDFKAGVVADGPLGGFGTELLKPRDDGVIAFSAFTDDNGGRRGAQIPLCGFDMFRGCLLRSGAR